MKKILKIIFFSKKIFNLPSQKKIVILDRNGFNRVIKPLLGNNDYAILDLRGESINLLILLLSFFNIFKYGKDAYKITFIKFVNPKIAITCVDTSLNICRFMNKISSCKLIMIQNGRRNGSELLSFIKKKINYELFVDYYFVFSENYANYAKKFIKGNFIIGGSVPNNVYKHSVHRPVKKVQYISEFHPIGIPGDGESYENWELKPTNFSLNVIDNFCKDNNLILEILGRTLSHDQEINYYKKFSIKFVYKKKENDNSNYLAMSEDAIIVAMTSTLLMEAFSRLYRTAFFSIRECYLSKSNFLKQNNPGFAFPKKTPDFGKFWSNIPNEENMRKNLDYLLSVDFSDWKSDVNEWSQYIMKHDYKNNVYKKILTKEEIYAS